MVKDYDPSIPDVYIDQGKIQQVVLNIVRNAQQALVDGGEITIKTRINHQHRRPGKAPKKALLNFALINVYIRNTWVVIFNQVNVRAII